MLLGKQQGVIGIPPITSKFVIAAVELDKANAKSRPTTRAPSVVWLTRGFEPRIELPTETGAVLICDTGPKLPGLLIARAFPRLGVFRVFVRAIV